MPSIVLTGGPGAGKTTLLGELARLGHKTVDESARAIIAERLAKGLSRRPAPLEFAREILARDIDQYERESKGPGWTFFDRGPIEALGMVHAHAPFPEAELRYLLSKFAFSNPVFVLPPWEEIYTTDSERDQTFEESVRVHAEITGWYRRCGYAVHDVPRLPPERRAEHVLDVLARGTA